MFRATATSASKSKVVRPKPQGEFVWVSDGSFGQYPAQLVIPIHENPPQDLGDSDMVEVRYTTSGKFDWVEKQHVEYPNLSKEEVPLGSRRSTPRRRKARRAPEVPLPPSPSAGETIEKIAVSPPRQKEAPPTVEAKLPSDNTTLGQFSDYVTCEEEEPEAINEKDGGQLKRTLAGVKGYYKKKSVAASETQLPKEGESNNKLFVENAAEEEILVQTKTTKIKRDIADGEDNKKLEESALKRQKFEAGEPPSTLSSLAAPLMNAGRAFFNGLFGKS